jgi:hypothetical protein
MTTAYEHLQRICRTDGRPQGIYWGDEDAESEGRNAFVMCGACGKGGGPRRDWFSALSNISLV